MSLKIEIARDLIQFELIQCCDCGNSHRDELALRWAAEVENLAGTTAIIGKGHDHTKFTVHVETDDGYFWKTFDGRIKSSHENEITTEILAAFEAAEAADARGLEEAKILAEALV